MYQEFYHPPLVLVLSHRHGLLQPIHDVADSLAIAAMGTPHLFVHALFVLHQRRVQSVRRRLTIVGVGLLHPVVEVLRLLLRHALIEMACRGQQQVLSVGLVHTLGQHAGIKNHGKQLLAHFLHRFALLQRQQLRSHPLQHLAQEFLAEPWLELLTAIVVVDAVRKPHALQIHLQRMPLGCFLRGKPAGTVPAGIHRLQHLPDAQVIASKLVKGDIPAP